MLLTSVIIVLREVLEASLLLSILLALSRLQSMRMHWWLYSAAAIGLAGAVGYGLAMPAISTALDGVGQEVVNSALQFGVYICLLWLCHSFIRSYFTGGPVSFWQSVGMSLVVILATIREGSEIFIYLSGFWYVSDARQSVGTGALIGSGIGFGVGALFYYLLAIINRGRALWLGCVLLAFVGAGMCLQSTQLLIQADWLPAHYPIWDSSSLLSESSVPGQLLYALVGYETQPTALQLTIYLSSLVLMALILVHSYRSYRK